LVRYDPRASRFEEIFSFKDLPMAKLNMVAETVKPAVAPVPADTQKTPAATPDVKQPSPESPAK
jgi:hypothetical protein